MKAIRMRIQKSSRPAVILLATVVAIITSIVVANATQTITTPNAAFISYNLATGTDSAAITPVTNKPVLLMGCNISPEPGVGHVTLSHLPGSPTVMAWTGLESYPASPAVTQGVSNTAGTHIVYFDEGHKVDIQLASADTIKIHNADTVTRAGNVTLIW